MKQIICFSFQSDTSCLKNIRSVSNGKGFFCVLLNQKNGCATFTYFFDNIKNLIYKDRRQTHGRLIHQNDLWFAHQRTAHCKHLLLTTGKCTGTLSCTFFQTRESLVYHFKTLRDLIFIFSCVGSHQKVFIYRHICKDTSSFRYVRHTHLNDLMCRCLCKFFASKADASCFCRNDSGQCLQCRCFTCSVCTDQCDNFSLFYMKGNPLQCLDDTIINLEIFYFQH